MDKGLTVSLERGLVRGAAPLLHHRAASARSPATAFSGTNDGFGEPGGSQCNNAG